MGSSCAQSRASRPGVGGIPLGKAERGVSQGGLRGRNLNGVPRRVQRFSGENQMNTHNLAIVFGPTLFQTDGKDYKAGRVVEDLISHYVKIFNVGSPPLRRCSGSGRCVDVPRGRGGGRRRKLDLLCLQTSPCFGDEGRGESVSLQTLETPKPGGAGTAGQGSRFPWEPASASAVKLKGGLVSPDSSLGSSSMAGQRPRDEEAAGRDHGHHEDAGGSVQWDTGESWTWGPSWGTRFARGPHRLLQHLLAMRQAGGVRAGWGGFGPHVGRCRLKCFPVALQQAGDFICTVYLEEKKTEAEQHVKVSGGTQRGQGPPVAPLCGGMGGCS